MRKTILTSLFIGLNLSLFAQIYISKSCEINFFAGTSLEDIDATNKAAKPILNTATGDIQVKIPITLFVFKRPLMQEHFNENYLESDKFPDAVFKGKIKDVVDYTKDGITKVKVSGKMNMHGVEKEIVIDGTITIKGQEISLHSEFNIHIADYNISVPTVVTAKIAEDVKTKIDAVLEPYKKK